MTNQPAETASELYLDVPGSGTKLFVDRLMAAEEAPNIIFCGTPLTGVTRFRPCYEPLVKLGFNVFAFDFTGIGRREGRARDFSLKSVTRDFDLLVKHIQARHPGPLFLFGGVGSGGILAQHYAAAHNNVAALAQYGLCLSGDPAPLKRPPAFLKFMHRLLKIAQSCAHFHLLLHPPAYSGPNRDQEEAFYEELKRTEPDIFKVDVGFATLFLSLFLGYEGRSEKDLKVPTLVFKPRHDRYYSPDYIDRFYHNLNCPKRLVEIDDVHSAYYFQPQAIAEEVADWFRAWSGREKNE